ncbi:MAG: ATP-grasp domain-containing protein [Terriglobia bacterium]
MKNKLPRLPKAADDPGRLMILCSTTGYQTRAFVEAAREMGLPVALGSDRCHVLDDPWRNAALPLRFESPEDAAQTIVEYARANPLQGIVALGDRTAPSAARASAALGLPFHPPAAADVCRDKYLSRRRLRAAGLNVPSFERYPIDSDPRAIIRDGGPQGGFPCVLKPLALSASRGVIRANDEREFVTSFERIRALLRTPEVQVMREETSGYLQVEAYVDGQEIAAEGVVDRGRVKLLAMFDKPDPLDGPYFEETIYVTPSRLHGAVQREVEQTLVQAIAALGLFHGPFHAELRLNHRGVWPLEVAARSIGGLCAKALRFSLPGQPGHVSLEHLLIRLALGGDALNVQREEAAAGVMMIPVEREGVYEGLKGLDEARRTPGVEDIVITAVPKQHLVPLPEGGCYVGFIFAHGRSPECVEAALRAGRREMHFQMASTLTVI